MTIKLKSCYGWVVTTIIVNLFLLSIFIWSQERIVELEQFVAEGRLTDDCDFSLPEYQKIYCNYQNHIYDHYGLNYLLLIIHSVIDLAIFLWINSRQKWFAWESCDKEN